MRIKLGEYRNTYDLCSGYHTVVSPTYKGQKEEYREVSSSTRPLDK